MMVFAIYSNLHECTFYLEKFDVCYYTTIILHLLIFTTSDIYYLTINLLCEVFCFQPTLSFYFFLILIVVFITHQFFDSFAISHHFALTLLCSLCYYYCIMGFLILTILLRMELSHMTFMIITLSSLMFNF